MSVAISPVATYALVLGAVLVICLGANLLRPAMRECPLCGKSVRMDARWCRRCRYRF